MCSQATRPHHEVMLLDADVKTSRYDLAHALANRSHPRDDEASSGLEADPGAGFAHVITAVDRAAAGIAVRQQAEALAGPAAVVEAMPAQPLTVAACGPLLDRCDGADLLAVSAANDAHPLLDVATMAILFAQPGYVGTNPTDRILVAVDGSVDPTEAARVAGSLAVRDRSQVAVVAAPKENASLERAVAATSRSMLDSAGAIPEVFGRHGSPESVVASAADAYEATLVVLAVGPGDDDKARAARITQLAGRSVLAVPAHSRAT